MGYRRKTYSLKWEEGHALHGLEVSLTGLSIGRMTKITALAASLTSDDAPVEEKLAKADELFHLMAGCLVAWNLEDEQGEPVPASYEGLADQDADLVAGIAFAWMETAVSVDTPLPESSNGGPAPMPEASLPMVPLSPSPLS
jgi:hypothetical protein